MGGGGRARDNSLFVDRRDDERGSKGARSRDRSRSRSRSPPSRYPESGKSSNNSNSRGDGGGGGGGGGLGEEGKLKSAQLADVDAVVEALHEALDQPAEEEEDDYGYADGEYGGGEDVVFDPPHVHEEPVLVTAVEENQQQQRKLIVLAALQAEIESYLPDVSPALRNARIGNVLKASRLKFLQESALAQAVQNREREEELAEQFRREVLPELQQRKNELQGRISHMTQMLKEAISHKENEQLKEIERNRNTCDACLGDLRILDDEAAELDVITESKKRELSVVLAKVAALKKEEDADQRDLQQSLNDLRKLQTAFAETRSQEANKFLELNKQIGLLINDEKLKRHEVEQLDEEDAAGLEKIKFFSKKLEAEQARKRELEEKENQAKKFASRIAEEAAVLSSKSEEMNKSLRALVKVCEFEEPKLDLMRKEAARVEEQEQEAMRRCALLRDQFDQVKSKHTVLSQSLESERKELEEMAQAQRENLKADNLRLSKAKEEENEAKNKYLEVKLEREEASKSLDRCKAERDEKIKKLALCKLSLLAQQEKEKADSKALEAAMQNAAEELRVEQERERVAQQGREETLARLYEEHSKKMSGLQKELDAKGQLRDDFRRRLEQQLMEQRAQDSMTAAAADSKSDEDGQGGGKGDVQNEMDIDSILLQDEGSALSQTSPIALTEASQTEEGRKGGGDQVDYDHYTGQFEDDDWHEGMAASSCEAGKGEKATTLLSSVGGLSVGGFNAILSLSPIPLQYKINDGSGFKLLPSPPKSTVISSFEAVTQSVFGSSSSEVDSSSSSSSTAAELPAKKKTTGKIVHAVTTSAQGEIMGILASWPSAKNCAADLGFKQPREVSKLCLRQTTHSIITLNYDDEGKYQQQSPCDLAKLVELYAAEKKHVGNYVAPVIQTKIVHAATTSAQGEVTSILASWDSATDCAAYLGFGATASVSGLCLRKTTHQIFTLIYDEEGKYQQQPPCDFDKLVELYGAAVTEVGHVGNYVDKSHLSAVQGKIVHAVTKNRDGAFRIVASYENARQCDEMCDLFVGEASRICTGEAFHETFVFVYAENLDGDAMPPLSAVDLEIVYRRKTKSGEHVPAIVKAVPEKQFIVLLLSSHIAIAAYATKSLCMQLASISAKVLKEGGTDIFSGLNVVRMDAGAVSRLGLLPLFRRAIDRKIKAAIVDNSHVPPPEQRARFPDGFRQRKKIQLVTRDGHVLGVYNSVVSCRRITAIWTLSNALNNPEKRADGFFVRLSLPEQEINPKSYEDLYFRMLCLVDEGKVPKDEIPKITPLLRYRFGNTGGGRAGGPPKPFFSPKAFDKSLARILLDESDLFHVDPTTGYEMQVGIFKVFVIGEDVHLLVPSHENEMQGQKNIDAIIAHTKEIFLKNGNMLFGFSRIESDRQNEAIEQLSNDKLTYNFGHIMSFGLEINLQAVRSKEASRAANEAFEQGAVRRAYPEPPIAPGFDEDEDEEDEENEDQEVEEDDEDEEDDEEELEEEEGEEVGELGATQKVIFDLVPRDMSEDRLKLLRPQLRESLEKGINFFGMRILLSYKKQDGKVPNPNYHTDRPKPPMNQGILSFGADGSRYTEFVLTPLDKSLPRLVVQVAYGSASPHVEGYTTNVLMIMNVNNCVFPFSRHESYSIHHGTGTNNSSSSATPVAVVGFEYSRTKDLWPASKVGRLVLPA